MNAPTPEEWLEQVHFYESLVGEHHWRQERMLRFVKPLAGSTRLVRPMVYLRFVSPAAGFELTYQAGQGISVESEWVAHPEEPAVMARIAQWLLGESVARPE
jgi:hypothetical protein